MSSPPPYTRVENFKDPSLNHGSLKLKSRRLKVENTQTGNSIDMIEGPKLFSKYFPYIHKSTLTWGALVFQAGYHQWWNQGGHRDISPPPSLRLCFTPPTCPPPPSEEKMAKISHFWIFAPSESHFAPWKTTLIMWFFNGDDIQLQIQVPPPELWPQMGT